MLQLLLGHLPGKVAFEGKGTPGTVFGDVLGAQCDEQQIRHQGQRHRALDPLWVFGDLGLSQAHHAFGLFDEQLDDPEVYPIRGQIIRVQRPPAMEPTIVDVHTDSDELTYIVPRRHDCLLGGTAQAHDWQTAPDAATARGILARCTGLVPCLGELEVLEHKVGLRPGRRTVRVEREDRSPSFAIIHNYGHGGAGFTLSWGCAEEVVALLQRFCNTR